MRHPSWLKFASCLRQPPSWLKAELLSLVHGKLTAWHQEQYNERYKESEGKQDILGSSSMTRKEDLINDQSYFECPCCQFTRCIETKGNLKRLHTIEEILGLDDGLITEDCLGCHNTRQADKKNNKLPDLTVEIAHKQEEQNNHDVVKTDSEYVSLNLHLLKRAQSERGKKYNINKPNCYFGRMEEDNERIVLRRTKSAQDAFGISESPVFFSSIGEWTIIDLNHQVFEKEDAKRTVYVRRKRPSYKEVEPENVCRIL